jgi:hypothetical protein
MRFILALFAVCVYAFPVPDGMVLTPFGVRPKGCVVQVESGTHIHEVAEGLKLVTEINGVTHERIVVPPQECHEDNVVAKYLAVKEANKKKNSQVGVPDGWLDNAGWYPPSSESNLDSFVSTYTIPGNPAVDGGQVLFYFIGMQDNDSPSAVNIIQPVLTWGNGVKGWNVASWDCCPKNITVQSPTISGLQAGGQLVGTLKRQSADTWIIDSTVLPSGKNTTLYSHVGDYIYNWADVTLEVYSVATCNEFATGPMTFSGLVLKDQQQQTLTPSWTKTGTTGCNGHLVQVDATTITIQHN